MAMLLNQKLVKAFGIPPVTLKRAVKLYREKGAKGFFEPKRRGGPRVLTPAVVEEIERFLDDNKDITDIAKQMGIKKDTIVKGMQQGRLKKNKRKNDSLTTKSQRSVEDSQAPMGMGATNTLDRLAASIGRLDGVTPTFKDCADVPNGGVLLALPALISQGLLSHVENHFELPKGYYPLSSIFILFSLHGTCPP